MSIAVTRSREAGQKLALEVSYVVAISEILKSMSFRGEFKAVEETDEARKNVSDGSPVMKQTQATNLWS